MKNIFYVVNTYGTPPLNYLEKYLKENQIASVTVLKLPAIRLVKNRLTINAFIKDEKGTKHEININLFFPFPYFFTYLFQYPINFILLFVLLSKINRKAFDIAIGETNFGSCISYLLKRLNIVRFSVFFNGDIIPNPKWTKNCFFLPSNNKGGVMYKHIDNFIIKMQYWLRSFGYKNDLVWFASKKIADYDSRRNLKNMRTIINDPILIDYHTTVGYSKSAKKMNTLCYIGRIDDYVGLDIIIPALKQIKKRIPNIQLMIIGGSEVTFEKYRLLAIQHAVESSVVYHGFIPKIDDALDLMSHAALGMALYKPVIDNVSLYTQPGKIKEYIKVGIPVLIAKRGPEIGKQVIAFNAGVESDYTSEDVARVIIKTLSDEKVYREMQRGVLNFAKEYNYPVRLNKIWHEIEKQSALIL
jgi:glycosyltransferase involved in cell wall biosynthesis